uniref:C2H2-type domain-containing protein n=1 Tax=Anopheles farauti TaxID=69004 RepID=A0A182QYB1_9DIPT
MAFVKVENSAVVAEKGTFDSQHQQCGVCLNRTACIGVTDPILHGKDVLTMVSQHLDIKITLVLICQLCYSRLIDFDEFYRMVSEQHGKIQHNTSSSTHLDAPNRAKEQSELEFVEIKHESLVDELAVKEEQEANSADDYHGGKLSTELSEEEDDNDNANHLQDNDEEYDAEDGETNSVSSKDSEDTYTPSSHTTRGSGTSKPTPSTSAIAPSTNKEPKLDQEILDFYQRLVCEVCDEARMLAGEPPIEYGNLRELNKHMRKAHGQLTATSIKCPMCEKKFRSRAKLLEHREMHLNPDRFRCAVCQEVHQDMAQHMKNKHQERAYCCEECGKRFPFKARLTAHVNKMHTAKDVVCDQCQKSFSRYTIEDHKRAVHGSRFICEHCPRTFKSRQALEVHMEEHMEEGQRIVPTVTCEKCGVVLRDKYSLRSHESRMHREHPPVSCGSCGKVFKSKHNLNAHLANVCTERTFPCPICEKQFKKKIKLKEHMTTHTKSALYQCPYCTKTFSFETQLYTHRKQAHYEQWLEMQRKRKEGVRFKVNRVKDVPTV